MEPHGLWRASLSPTSDPATPRMSRGGTGR
jgi:hypothetical protein